MKIPISLHQELGTQYCKSLCDSDLNLHISISNKISHNLIQREIGIRMESKLNYPILPVIQHPKLKALSLNNVGIFLIPTIELIF